MDRLPLAPWKCKHPVHEFSGQTVCQCGQFCVKADGRVVSVAGEWVRPDYGSHTCVSGIVRPYEGNLCAHPTCWSPTTPPPTEPEEELRARASTVYEEWINRGQHYDAFIDVVAAALARAKGK